jgi:hypothetical protein
LDDVLRRNTLLVGDGRDAASQLLQLPKAGRNYGKIHILTLLAYLSCFKSPAPDIPFQPPATNNLPPTNTLTFLRKAAGITFAS